MPGQFSIAAFSSAAFAGLASAMVPADPTITSPALLPRQNNDRFIGFVQSSGSWYSQACDAGLTWYQDGKYAQCCPTSLQSCYAPTACVSGSLIYPYSDKSTTRTIACTDNYNNPSLSICNTAFIFENSADSNPKTDIVCGPSSVNWSYYRSVPASATQIKSEASSIPQPSAVQPASGSSGSKAWIAGAVIGPIAGLAIIGAAIFFFLRSKKNKGTANQQGAVMAPADPSHPPAGVAGYTDAKPQFSPQQQQTYPNQGAYATQQGYDAPTSPTQYPPGQAPQQTYYANDVKHAHETVPLNGAAELGGETSGAAPAASASAGYQAAELGGGDAGQHNAGQHGAGLFAPSELPSHNGPK